MDPAILNALVDELNKIACDDSAAKRANALFGLPLADRLGRNVRRYDQGSSAAQSPDRSQSPIDGQSTANISSSNSVNPATGPGGV